MRKVSSAEHLYEATDFEDKAGIPKSATNSPQVPRKSPDLGDHAPSPTLPLPNRNFLASPPNLDELKEGVDSSQLYAQVVAPPKQQPTKKDELPEKKKGDAAAAAGVSDQASNGGVIGTSAAVGPSDVKAAFEEQEKELLVVTSLDDRFGRVVSPEREVKTEIEHMMQGDDAYAVVPTKLKKKIRKRKMESSEKDKANASVQPSSSESEKKSLQGPGKVPPPKPPKSYRDHQSSSHGGSSPTHAPSTVAKESAGSPTQSYPTPSSSRNLSPPPADTSLALTPQERSRVASFSSGPPSFPPPPPPKSMSPDSINESIDDNEGGENPYNTIDGLKKPKRKAPIAPAAGRRPSFNAQNGTQDKNEPGYETVKSDRGTGQKKKSAPGPPRNRPDLVHIDKVSKPHLTPNQRAPHLYSTFEDYEDESGEVKSKESSIAVPVKTPSAGYATVSHPRRGSQPQPSAKKNQHPPPMVGRLSKHPKLSPKTRPPPPPPGKKRPSELNTLTPPGPVVTESGSHSADDQLGKRIFVSMENSPTPDSGGPEPKFLFSHAQKFIVVSLCTYSTQYVACAHYTCACVYT